MTAIELSSVLFVVATGAGFLGALTGLGGGVIITPILVILFHVNMLYAMGVSLIAVIATSSGTAAAYLKEGYTNLRIGIFLEVGAVAGALMGAVLTGIIPINVLSIIFGLVMLFSAYFTIKRQEEGESYSSSHGLANRLKLNGVCPDSQGNKKAYFVQHVPAAFGIMTIAGALSGLLGIGSGTVKVLAMDQAMRLPYKVATTTSNFMIGITAAASASVYFSKGYIHPSLVFPVVLGVVAGSLAGAKILHGVKIKTLRIVFSIIISFLAFEMIYNGIIGNI